MYEPVRVPRGRPSRRRIKVFFVLLLAFLSAVVVTVIKTMPHNPPVEQLSLDELAMMVPDAQQTELIAAIVRTRIANARATPKPAARAARAVCRAPKPPHTWDKAQRENARTIVEVGLALDFPDRGLVVALATAM